MVPLVLAIAIVAVLMYFVMQLHAWLAASWFLVRLWRWFTGMPHHGKHITNAGWTRKGYGQALTPTGHAHHWWYLPRWKRSAHRTGGTVALLAVVYGLLAATLFTIAALSAAFLASLAWACLRVVRAVQERKHRRTWLHPLHLAAHEIAGHPRALPAKDWITAELDSAGAVVKATLELPEGFPAEEKDKQRLTAITAAKLGIENAEPHWRTAGPAPLLTLVHSPPPPGRFGIAHLVPELEKLKPDEWLIGIGKNEELAKASLTGDSPHIAISMGTGAGKSNLAGWLLLQNLLREGIGQVLDPKQRLSYPWILKDERGNFAPLPNVAYAWTTAELHEAMSWLPDELDRRAKVAFAGMTARGKVHANVGPRLFTLAEELNMALGRLRAHWNENRGPGDPAKSPAFTGMGEEAFAGRQVYMNLVMIGQMLTAEVTGSRDSSVREQCGIMMLARYRQKGWKMMAGDIPMPPAPQETGRVQLVTAGPPREVQTPELDGVLARELVLAADMALLPARMPCQPQLATVASASVSAPPSDLGGQSIAIAPAPLPLPGRGTFKEALRAGVLHPGTTLSGLEMGRFRDPDFPDRAGLQGRAYEYDFAALAAWDFGRRS